MDICSKCGVATDSSTYFCKNCGTKIIKSQTSGILNFGKNLAVPPKDLILLPGEEIIARHNDFLASNKRVIRYKKEFIGSAHVLDLSYDHINRVQETTKKPALIVGMIIGSIFVLASLAYLKSMDFSNGVVTLIIGALALFSAYRIEENDLFIIGTDGHLMIIPQIKSKTGIALSHAIKTHVNRR
jgi:hypothetical protein